MAKGPEKDDQDLNQENGRQMHYISTFNKEEVMKYYNVLEAKNALSNKRKPRVSLTASFIHEAFPRKLQFYFQILLTSERVRFLQDSNFL